MPLPSYRPLPNKLSILELGRQLELAFAHLYEVLAEAHAGSAATSGLWRKTAREEHHHAAQFQLGMVDGGGMVTEVEIAWRDARQMIDTVERLARRYESSPPSIPEALGAAVDLEERLAHLHMNRACRFSNTPYQALFDAMMAADRRHIAMLREALQDYNAGRSAASPESAVRLSLR